MKPLVEAAPRDTSLFTQSQTPPSIVNTLPCSQWSRFVAEHPDGNIFNTPEMFEVFRHSRGYDPELWAAVDGARILALFVPVRVSLCDGPLRPFVTRAIAYGGVLAAPGEEGAWAVTRLLKTYKRHVSGVPLFTELRHLSDSSALQSVLKDRGFSFSPQMNYLVDLARPPEAIMASISYRTRRHIRHGLRKGTVTIREAEGPEQIAHCYDLLSRTYKAAGVPLADRSLFDAACKVLRPKNMIRCTLAWVGSTPVAVSIDLLYRETVYGWYGGVDRAFGADNPNELLTWHVFEWGSTHGYRRYDWGGAGVPGKAYGVRDFKSKFGGEEVSFGRNVCIHAPFRFRLSSAVYKVCRRWL